MRVDSMAGEHDAVPGGTVLDSAHVGDIVGAFGRIPVGHETSGRPGARNWWRTLLAVVGPGLIVMVGDNDAGAFSTYSQAGQNYGTALLWTLLLLVPVIYVNQEMVVRLGAVTGVGHARLIFERFGRFWGAFSVIDLFVLNALTIVTEFIGISLGLGYLHIPRLPGVVLAAVLIVAAASTGSFRRFEQVSMALVAGSLVLIPIFVMVHPPLGQVAHDVVVPQLPGGSGQLATVMLLVIAIVGTTVAPWQLFFQQSYLIDKRITPRYMRYEKVDLWIGIVVVVVGAVAMMSFSAAAFQATPGAGHFTDAAGVAAGLAHAGGRIAGVLFAIALIDASIIGAAAVGLSTSYAIGDVLGLRHSLHRKPSEAKGFYTVFGLLLLGSAIIVLIPGSPLGLITEGVQTLAGVLLPSATMFLLLLCNDKAVLGPFVNGRKTNVFSGAVVIALLLLSVILTVAVVFPSISAVHILWILGAGVVLSAAGGGWLLVTQWRRHRANPVLDPIAQYDDPAGWRMPSLSLLERPEVSLTRRIIIGAMRFYLVAACVLVVVRVVQLWLAH